MSTTKLPLGESFVVLTPILVAQRSVRAGVATSASKVALGTAFDALAAVLVWEWGWLPIPRGAGFVASCHGRGRAGQRAELKHRAAVASAAG